MQEILDAYRQGDMGQRTDLFLSYRDLRAEFMTIEMEEAHTPVPEHPEAGEPGPHFCRCCTFLMNIFFCRS